MSSRGSEFECEWCQKPFKYPSQLKEHIRVHTREKPYPCTFCSKAFSHSSALTQHERIHTGEKPFKCQHCDKSFSQSSNLKRHERVHKNQRLPPQSQNVAPQRRPAVQKENQWPSPTTSLGSNPRVHMPSHGLATAGKKQAVYSMPPNVDPRRTKALSDAAEQMRVNAFMTRNLEQLVSPRSFKMYQMASPLRPHKDNIPRDVGPLKSELLSLPPEPRVERCSGGEDFFSVDSAQPDRPAAYSAAPIDQQAANRSTAISDSIEQYFDLSGPSLSPLMADEVFPMFILSPTMGLGGASRMGSPLAAREALESHDNLHFRF
eukprot:m.437819 g.437819  ORF g.437819 m.437819 type:complete len:319 (-) comp18164_c0_seq1:188-1144(-)